MMVFQSVYIIQGWLSRDDFLSRDGCLGMSCLGMVV